jgi:hypothetical protein
LTEGHANQFWFFIKNFSFFFVSESSARATWIESEIVTALFESIPILFK